MASVNGIEVVHTVGPYGIAVTPPGFLDNLVTYQPEAVGTDGVNYQWDDAVLALGYEPTGADMTYSDGGTNLVAKSSVQEKHGTQSLRLQKTTSDFCRARTLTDDYPMPTGVLGMWLYVVSVTNDTLILLEIEGGPSYVARLYITTGLSLSLRANAGASSETLGTLTADTWYYVQIRWDNPNALVQARLYDASGATLATTAELGAFAGNTVAYEVQVGTTSSTPRCDVYVDDLTMHRGYALRAPYQVDARDIPKPATFASTIAQALTATLSFTTARTRKVRDTLTATLSFTSAQTRKVRDTLTATLSFTTARTRKVRDTLTATLSFTSASVRKAKKTLTASWSGTGSLTRRTAIRKTVTGALSFTSAQSKKAKKTLTAATLSFTTSSQKLVRRGYAAAGSFTGSLTKRVRLILAASLNFSGSSSQSPQSVLPPFEGKGGWYLRWHRKRRVK
jgi:hypothetical protein